MGSRYEHDDYLSTSDDLNRGRWRGSGVVDQLVSDGKIVSMWVLGNK